MGQSIVSDNKPSAVALHQNHASIYRNAFNKMLNIYSKSRHAKNKVGWCWKTHQNILIMLLKVRIDRSQPQYLISTEIDRNTNWRLIWSTRRDTCPFTLFWQRGNQILHWTTVYVSSIRQGSFNYQFGIFGLARPGIEHPSWKLGKVVYNILKNARVFEGENCSSKPPDVTIHPPYY